MNRMIKWSKLQWIEFCGDDNRFIDLIQNEIVGNCGFVSLMISILDITDNKAITDIPDCINFKIINR